MPLRLAAGTPTCGVLLVRKDPRSVASDRRGRPNRTLTCVTRSAAARLDPRPPGDALPEEDSNPHSRSNNPTSFRLDDLASSTATGSRTPASGLRARRRVRWTTAAWRKRWDSHPQGPRDPYLFSGQAPHLAGSLPRWGPRWESHPRPRPYRGRALPH